MRSTVFHPFDRVYELVYTSITYGGMSGGAVLDTQERVIGIHGRAEGEEAIDEAADDYGLNQGKVQIGFSLGIPISTFLGLAEPFKLKPLAVQTTQPPSLNQQQNKDIEATILNIPIQQDNAKASVWLERGNQLFRLLKFPEAEAAFERAIQLEPKFVYLAWYGKGLALSKQKSYEAAVAALEQAIALKPDYYPALDQQSTVYRSLKRYDRALIAINKAIAGQPRNPLLYNEKYVVLGELKRHQEALEAISQAIQLAPRAAFYTNRGSAHADLKDYPQAISDYKPSHPNQPRIY